MILSWRDDSRVFGTTGKCLKTVPQVDSCLGNWLDETLKAIDGFANGQIEALQAWLANMVIR